MFSSSSSSKGRVGSSNPAQLMYPSPYFDIGSTYLPRTLKELFQYCKYYTLTNPVIHAIIVKLATYSVTDIIINESDAKLKDKWDTFLNDTIGFQSFQINIGLDYEAYGNGFCSIHFPFVKILECRSCGHKVPITGADYKYDNFEFKLTCKKCGMKDKAKAEDRYIKASSKIKLIRWNPEYIDIQVNRYNKDRIYLFNPPKGYYNDLLSGRKHIIENSPQPFLDAAKEKRAVAISSKNIFHLERSSISCDYDGWGTPRIFPVLKDAFYTQLMQKANEVLLMEHIIPLRVIHPSTSDAHANPYEHLNLATFKREVAKEIRTWRRDPNYVPIVNFPLGYQHLGGQGKMLLLVNELRSMYEILAAGTGCPQEFVFGGVSYSGSNVSLRMLENDFLRGIEQRKSLLNWVIKKVSHYMSWSDVSADFKPFKMADDLQRLAYYQQLQQMGSISRQSVVTYAGFDSDSEKEIMKREASSERSAMEAQKVAEAHAQGKAAEVMATYQAKAQLASQKEMMRHQSSLASQQMHEQGQMQSKMMEQHGKQQKEMMEDQMNLQMQAQQKSMDQQRQSQQGLAYVPPTQINANAGALGATGEPSTEKSPVNLQQLAKKLSGLIEKHPEKRSAVLKNVKDRLGSEMANLVAEMSTNQVDMRPLPEQKPPRRGPESAII